MIKDFSKYLKSIPQLSSIVVEFDNFRKSDNKNFKHLIMIIKKDRTLHQEILKIMDFNIFDFGNKPKNIQNFIALTSLEFIIALATSLAISKSIKSNLFSYALRPDDFLYSNTLALLILELWLGKVDKKLKNELLLPTFLQNLSKPLISTAISENKLTEQFLNEINNFDVASVEERFIGFNAQRVTANILKNWGLSHNIIFPINFSKDLENCPDEFKIKAIIIDIISQITDPRELLQNMKLEKAIKRVELFKLNKEQFIITISNIKECIKNNS